MESLTNAMNRKLKISPADKITKLQTEPHIVGCGDDLDARVVRIIHISDTHGKHDSIDIPDGDILIHSGDFFDWHDTDSFEDQTHRLDEFFARKSHRHKIFVAGNHELKFNNQPADIIQSHLPHATYLQDSSTVVEGLLVYGSPWTGKRTSPAYAFTTPYEELGARHWASIPHETDILVTHSPPYKILDHHGALGSKDLRRAVLRDIRPLAHLFGHAHCDAVVAEVGGVLFSNGSQCHYATPAVIDVCVARKTTAPHVGIDRPTEY